MAPVTFYLISLSSPLVKEAFVSALKALPPFQRPVWAGACHHWIHEPHLSVEALTGSGDTMKDWNYLIAIKGSHGIPQSITPYVSSTWSITAEAEDTMMDSLSERKAAVSSATPPALPVGWSASNHDGIDSALPVSGVEISLHTVSRPFQGIKASGGQPLKAVIRDLGIAHPGSVVMFNLLSFFPGGRERYFSGYGRAFQETLGPRSGGQPLLFGLGVSDWSSQGAERENGYSDDWEDTALIWYPSVWHFGKMLDDPVYADLDREFKAGVLKDNPLICCSDLSLY